MINTRLSQTSIGYVSAIIAAISYGSSGLFVKLAQQTSLDSINLLIVQHLISVPVLWLITFIKYGKKVKLDKKNLKMLFFVGACISSIVNILFYETFNYLDISIATILFYTYPIALALLSFLFLKEKLSRLTLLSLFIAFLGCVLVLNIFNTNNNISTIGMIYGLSASLGYAIFSIFLEKIDRNIPPLIYITYSTTFALIGYIIIKPPIQVFKMGLTGQQFWIIAALAFICQLPPNTLLFIAIRAIGAVKTSIVSNLEIPSAVILGYIFFKETLNFTQIMGILLVVAGIILMKNGDLLLYKLKDKY